MVRMDTVFARSVLVIVASACGRVDSSSNALPEVGASLAGSSTRVMVDPRGFTPSTVAVAQGRPTTVEFLRTSDATCAREVVLPALHITKPLPLNTPVAIAIPGDRAKTYTFTCGMGMLKGEVVVR